jgi:hypothetical protein
VRRIGILLAGLLGAAPLPADDEKSSLRFETHVRPLLKTHCFHCHGESSEKPKGKLDVRLARLLVKGGKSGPAVVPGKRDQSPLYKRLAEGEMPPEDAAKRPTPKEIELIGRWIDEGALTARPEPEAVPDPEEPTPEERAFWSFQPIRRPAVPDVDDGGRARTTIDRFLLAALAPKKLTFSRDADRLTLLRRATVDLTGLPPTPDEIAAFLADKAPDAVDRLVDRLLASPRYGERWGRHWLDVAGYADSEGYDEKDVERKWSWRFRDYVIRSFDADKPFDRFVQEQLAGDELLPPPYANLTAEQIELLAATGFLRMAPDGTGSKDAEALVARNAVMADTLKIVSTGLLGLTVGCAQCHNHRYDPIPQKDYYRLRAIFEPALNCQDWRTPTQRLVSLLTDAERKQSARIEAEAVAIDREREKKQAEYIAATLEMELAKIPDEMREALRWVAATPSAERTAMQKALLKEYPSVNVSPSSLYLYDATAADELKKIADRAAQTRATKPAEEFVHALTEVPGKIPATRLFHRGDPAQPQDTVAPGGLTVLSISSPARIPARDPSLPTTGRRLAFARWLTGGTHPLTARVLVNRVWMHHFGRGLVGTPADFGALGERPSHPELLDWLADDFMSHGWRLKRIHKMILTSTAYRQSSRRDPRGESVDPDNRLLWRMNVRRLEAEAIRDSMLAVAGNLNVKMFGPPVPVMADEVGQFVVGKENLDGEGKVGPPLPLNGEEFRRSIYVQARRSRPLSMMETFDAPEMEPNCESRSFSTVAPQALLLMNNQFVLSQADAFARRVKKDAGDDIAAQVARAWQLAFSRPASAVEAKEAAAFLTKTGTPQGLTRFCQALLSANEFLYVD